MANEKIKETIKKADDWTTGEAEKHGYPKWKIWLGVAIAGLAIVGVAHLLGWV